MMLEPTIQIELKSNAIAVAEAIEMWTLYEPYYHYSFEEFFRRIPRNTHYALYRQAGKLVGFTGLRIEKIRLNKKRYLTVYFGQTLVAPGVRGKGLIGWTGLRILRRFWKAFLTHRLVFWADALSYRAYLVFAKNVVDYYPNYREEVPEEMREVRDYLGHKHYGDRYCPVKGCVQKDQFLVRDPRMIVRPWQHTDPDLQYFLQANPSYQEGTGLLTLAPGHWRNTQYLLRKFRRKQVKNRSSSTNSRERKAIAV